MSGPDTAAKESLASHYALHVALQTMKDRCQNLQKSLTISERNNLELQSEILNLRRHNLENSTVATAGGESELVTLRQQVVDLTKEKASLAEQLTSYKMVAIENKNLWQRLSKINKDQNGDDTACLGERDLALDLGAPVANQNLVRSKTFTQNAPTFDQKTREKLNNRFDSELEASTTTSVLDNCDFIKTSNQNYDQIIEGLDCMEEEESRSDVSSDVKKCIDTMAALKLAVMRQQTDLRKTFSGLKQKKEVCKSCLKKQQQIEAGSTKVVTVDKSSATDPITSADLELELLKELKFDMEDVKKLEDLNDQSTIDLSAAKRQADHAEKMCPLCGKVYSSNIMFDTFQEHVESHFVDDLPAAELSLERNFEVISHSVGNF